MPKRNTPWQEIARLRTTPHPHLPGAQDVEAMNNRVLALDWLHRLAGRDDSEHPKHSTYTGLADLLQQAIEDQNATP
jgi:hypothetical protein